MRCPNCGSSAQLKVQATDYIEDGWTIEVVRYYSCGCGKACVGKSYYHCQEGYEYMEPIPKEKLQEKLYGGVDKPSQMCYN